MIEHLSIARYTLVAILLILTSYIIILDDKKILINSDINFKCNNNVLFFILAILIISLVLFCVSKLSIYLLFTLCDALGITVSNE